jgi:hypothetical protein
MRFVFKGLKDKAVLQLKKGLESLVKGIKVPEPQTSVHEHG